MFKNVTKCAVNVAKTKAITLCVCVLSGLLWLSRNSYSNFKYQMSRLDVANLI